jgi:hypothetical protein
MMAVNLKFCLKLVTATLLMVGCGATNVPAPIHRCQAVVVVDKTNSVSYTNKLPLLQARFGRAFEGTYVSSVKDIQTARLVITGNTGVFPELHSFYTGYPQGEEGSRSYDNDLQRWNIEKRKWIAVEERQTIALIESACNSNTTDIFSIFNGIGQLQTAKGHWDSINVFIFSDMTNTCASTINMNSSKQVTVQNAFEKGKTICHNLMTSGQLSSGNTDNLYLTIYTPDKMDNTALVSQFWKGFFEQWGLAEDHYHFE